MATVCLFIYLSEKSFDRVKLCASYDSRNWLRYKEIHLSNKVIDFDNFNLYVIFLNASFQKLLKI